ncbi:DUF1697 domain-containing protein [Tepidamorphus sp. 3E244]|uniref:DUF1697 domain-containing protein n=1 Tax=Tepidamorphus sp. 3E244 TaxID=3385498 RepID=UPI0038FC4B0F
MTRHVALLRAVNVGGTGKLPMPDLKAMCEDAGLENVRAYIASGNVVFDTKLSAAKARDALETRLEAYAGKRVDVFIRTAADMARILKDNPFPDEEPKYTTAIFLDEAPKQAWLDEAKGCKDAVMKLGQHEIYVHYPSGMGRSKLKIPAAERGTARNLNTVAKLAGMAAGD